MKVRTALLADPLTTVPAATIEELLPRMVADRDGTAAVVSADGEFLGVIGVTDVLAKIVPLYVDLKESLAEVVHASYLEEHLDRVKDLKVSDLMVSPVATVQLEDSLFQAAAKIVEHGRRVLPALDGERFVSFISRSSLLAAVLEGRKSA